MDFYYILKRITKILKLGRFFRKLRCLFYKVVDLLGYIFIKPFIFIKDKKQIKKILIIRLDRIGDVILSTPAIRAIRESFPDTSIYLLVREYTKDLVINNPNINRLIIYEQDYLERDFDLAIALHPGIKPNYLTFKSGAFIRVGYKGRGGSFFLTHKIWDDREKRIRHEVISALEVVGLIGARTKNLKLEVSITPEGEKEAEEFLLKNSLKPQDKIVIIHPGARQEYIRWKKEGFSEVADRLIREYNLKVILIGGNEEMGLLKEILFLMKEKAILGVGLRVSALVSLIKRAKLFIGNSTGPMHIAVALGIPVVAIFGNVHPLDSYQEWGPWGENNIVVSKNLKCKKCHPSDCLNFDCMRLISPEDVLEAVKKLLSLNE